MRNRIVILLLTCAFLSFECLAFGQNGQGGDSQGQNSQGDQGKPVPGAEVFWAKGQRPAKAQYSSSSSTNLRWWGGTIMPTVQTQAIFWGPNWSDATFTGDKITGLDTFYIGMGSSDYAKTAEGLPYIGSHRNFPHHLFAFGDSSHSLTGSYLASRVLLRSFIDELEPSDKAFEFNR